MPFLSGGSARTARICGFESPRRPASAKKPKRPPATRIRNSDSKRGLDSTAPERTCRMRAFLPGHLPKSSTSHAQAHMRHGTKLYPSPISNSMPFSAASNVVRGTRGSSAACSNRDRHTGPDRQETRCQPEHPHISFGVFTCQGGEGPGGRAIPPTVQPGAGAATPPLCRRHAHPSGSGQDG